LAIHAFVAVERDRGSRLLHRLLRAFGGFQFVSIGVAESWPLTPLGSVLLNADDPFENGKNFREKGDLMSPQVEESGPPASFRW
jgi:hypothetical protein